MCFPGEGTLAFNDHYSLFSVTYISACGALLAYLYACEAAVIDPLSCHAADTFSAVFILNIRMLIS